MRPTAAALRATSAAFGVLALAACAALPSAAPAPGAKPAAAYATAQAFAAAPAAWPDDHWWTAYGDAQLDGLMDEALKGSPTLAAAGARVRRAEALANQARAAESPSVAADLSVQETKFSYNNGIPPAFTPHGYNPESRAALDFSWELDFWGKNRAAVAAATSETRATQADAAQARLMLSTSVASAYADLDRLYRERDLADRTLALRQETSGLVAQRVSSGLDTRGEQRQAESEPLQAQADLAAVDEQIALTRNRLAALLGAGPDRGLSIARPPAEALKPFGVPANLAADLLGRRPDVVAARWRAEAATRGVDRAKAAFYPDVNLTGFLGFQALTLDTLLSKGSDIGQFGPALSLPIFEGGKLRAGLRGAEADRDAAVAAYDGAVTEALHQVADAVTGERALQTELTSSRAALAASEEAWNIAQLRYKGGLSAYPAVLLAEQSVIARRRAVADLESRALALDVALVRALGGGFAGA